MACFYPIQAYKPDLGGSIIFTERAGYRPFSICCGQCIGCRLERSRQWAVRCLHESQLYDASSFVTLTYSDEHVPVDGSLRYSDYQRFMRRVRRRFRGVRFYMAGEYGEKGSRPHYHAVLFGVHFGDRYNWRQSPAGFPLYRSDLLDSLWTLGSAEIGDVTFESAGYVARYVMKKVTGDKADEHYKRVSEDGEIYWLTPEFNRMSLKPGIGARWFEKYKAQTYPRDYIIVRGKKMRPPKYYDELLKLDSSFLSDDVAYDRYKKSLEILDENTPERLLTREIVLRAGLAFKKRTI